MRENRIKNKIDIGGDNSGKISQTGVSITGGVHDGVDAATLATLIDRLRSEVSGQQLAKQEVLEDVLDDLAADVRDEAEPVVVRTRWEKAKGLLSGVSQFTELIAKISEHIAKLFG